MEKARKKTIGKTWFSAVFVVCKDEMIRIRDPKFDDSFWKTAGGSVEFEAKEGFTPDKIPEDTGRREVVQETGIEIDEMWLIHQEEYPGNHTRYFYLAVVENFDSLLTRGDEWEIVETCSVEDFIQMPVGEFGVGLDGSFRDYLFPNQEAAREKFIEVLGGIGYREDEIGVGYVHSA